MRRLLALLLALALPAAASAHDFWLEREAEGLVLRYGHRGGDALPIEAGKVKAARCLEKGAPRDLLSSARFAPRQVTFAGRCDAASATFDGGFWSLTPDGEVNRPKDEVPQAVKAWASRQFAKWVDARTPAAPLIVLGDELELVVASDLTKAREGDKITVRVLSQGKPVPDAMVAIDHKPLGESDSQGEVRVKLRSSTVETVSATLRRRLASPKADSEVLEASLTFEVAR
ncbi:MAG: DUF4198 domain-containing protein [Anaeromyxobacteraceae bacterium]